MRNQLLFAIALILIIAVVTIGIHGQRTGGTTLSHTQWVSSVLKETQSIKVGMSRKDLLKVYTTEGGISSRSWRTYAYRGCPYIKVDVQFQPMQLPGDSSQQLPDDKIISISKPYLEYSVAD
jgi:hypothetical protein